MRNIEQCYVIALKFKGNILLKELCVAHNYFSPVDKNCVQFLLSQDTSFSHGVVKTLR